MRPFRTCCTRLPNKDMLGLSLQTFSKHLVTIIFSRAGMPPIFTSVPEKSVQLRGPREHSQYGVSHSENQSGILLEVCPKTAATHQATFRQWDPNANKTLPRDVSRWHSHSSDVWGSVSKKVRPLLTQHEYCRASESTAAHNLFVSETLYEVFFILELLVRSNNTSG
jgi:hypothetical protein